MSGEGGGQWLYNTMRSNYLNGSSMSSPKHSALNTFPQVTLLGNKVAT